MSNKRARRQAQTIIALSAISIWIAPDTARGEESFLWLPFPIGTRTPGDCRGDCSTTGVCIYCTWSSCVDGTAYNHRATDYGCTGHGTEVRVAAGGEVIFVDDVVPENSHPRGRPYGNRVEIRHANRYVTIYAHFLPGIRVSEGERVAAGQLLGLTDNTGQSSGPHLHFEVRDPQGRRVNPYGDPADYTGGCGLDALWVTCPPTPAPPPDADGDGYTVAAGDCNDANRDVHPDADESCNERDDDCNGTADDPWRIGLAQDLGNPCTVSTGICANTGTWTCAPNGVTTVCSVDALPSQPESCNGLDDDCDGDIDEDWRSGLAQDISNPCTIEWDTCRGNTSGTWVCAPGGLSTVCDAPTPFGAPAAAEICNGVDDDCDGAVDNIPDRVIVDYPTEPSTMLSHLSSALDSTRQQVCLSWVETRPDGTGFASVTAPYAMVLDPSGNPVGSARSLSPDAYSTTIVQTTGWSGDEYGVIRRVVDGSSFSDRLLLFFRLDPDGAPIREPVTVGEPLLIAGFPISDVGGSMQLVATSDGWLAAEGGPFTQQDANQNLYGNIILTRFSREGAIIGAPVYVNDDTRRDIDARSFGLASIGGREVLTWAIRLGAGLGIIGEIWEGMTRTQQAMILTSSPSSQRLSHPAMSCAVGASCWFAWRATDDFSLPELVLGTLNSEPFTVADTRTMIPPPDFPGGFRLSCTEDGCTIGMVGRAIDGLGYFISVVTTPDVGAPPTIVRTITRGESFDRLTGEIAMQRTDTTSVIVWLQEPNRLVRTAVCH